MVAIGFWFVVKLAAVVGQFGAVVYCATAVTVFEPVLLSAVTVIEFVPCPPVIVHPPGTVHIYWYVPPTVVEPGEVDEVNTFPVEFEQTWAGPEIDPG